MTKNYAFDLCVVRLIVLAALLLLEILGASFVADFQPFANATGRVAGLVSAAPHVARALVVAVVFLTVLERANLGRLGQQWARLAARDRAWPIALAVHLGAAGFVCLLWPAVRDSAGAHLAPLLAWLSAIAAGLAAWAVAVAPILWWRRITTSARLLRLAGSIVVGIAVAAASLQLRRLWRPMTSLTYACVSFVMEIFSDEVVSHPDTAEIGVPAFVAQITPECSGYEGIGLVLGALAAFFLLFRRELRWPHAWLLAPIGVIAIWAANIVRIAALIGIGATISPEIAAGGFHSQAGWLGFTAVTVALAGAALRSPFFSRRLVARANDPAFPAADRATTNANSAAYLAPLLTLLLASMVVGALSAGFDWLYPIKITAAAAIVWRYRASYEAWTRPYVDGTAVVTGIGVFVLWIAFERSVGATPVLGPPAQLVTWHPALAAAWLVFRAVGSTLVIPIVEELAFRGYLMRRISAANFESIRYRDASWMAVVLSSILFGLLHSRLLAAAGAGLAYAWIARRNDRLQDAIVAHATTNGLIAAYVLLGGAWHLW